jgi:hypothetical protein
MYIIDVDVEMIGDDSCSLDHFTGVKVATEV